jgi:glycerol-3-phosphate acyltransferase PlsY
VSGDSPATFAFALLFLVPGYVIGSISSGYLVGKVYRNVDLRRVGSGSTGATNTLRALGPGAAALVALLDILKGVVAVWLARALVPEPAEVSMLAQGAAAIGAVAGHCWPMLLAGRGGRGVAVGFGAIMVVATEAWAVAVAGFVLGLVLTRIVSVASLSAVAGALLGYAALTAAGVIAVHAGAVVFLVVAAAIIVYRHRANIDRLMRGVEPRLGRT